MAEATDEHKPCATCGKIPAVKRCSACKTVKYCSEQCQKNDWNPRHMQQCNIEQRVKRAGALLQKLFLEVRERNFNFRIRSVERSSGELSYTPEPKVPGRLYRFETDVQVSNAEKKMILSASTCMFSIAYFYDILRKMLEGTDVQIHEVNLGLKRPTKIARIMTKQGVSEFDSHWIFRVTATESKKQWYLDPSGPQFNIFETCSDAGVYLTNHVEEVRLIVPAGSTKRLYEKLATVPGGDGKGRQMTWKMIETVDLTITKWEANAHTPVPKLLREKEMDFLLAEKSLLDFIASTFDDLSKTLDWSKEILTSPSREAEEQRVAIRREHGSEIAEPSKDQECDPSALWSKTCPGFASPHSHQLDS
ncbi:hypothetical protein P153DRAFT_392635 [Dothidotthia symphoricarpi CBS 119687]|uniref:MYND-type domain-containing protein n=1 Tax=Dothidotthia symphoricarpi CBS 119687 TaxID=1392245 RepID=A0A6A6APT8_9PLEO|nr:uncharacterized protein P153DRAFT_392635 [Dothidotthia symphoricarpi CBS 119687]KAF2134012.1 hypothetical protein P153DRAFT_392635 [Dothidotthia symphoricarpi CBS 119687]